jgi:hypothetical protein
MDKIHYQTDQEDLMRLCGGEMFTFYDENIKSAASDTFTKDLLKEHAPDKDHFMLHVVAMGDQETYGPNKNGDGFPKEALEKFTPTFITDGCFFREHRNRCQETQGIGTIKGAAFNPKMRRTELVVHGNKKKAEKEYEMAKAGKALSFSMSCFPAGTLVQLANGTEKPIELVNVGEKVITHKGNAGAVSHIMHRSYTGAATHLRAYGLPEALVCTSDHGVWTRPAMRSNSECPVCGSKFKSLKAHLRQKKDSKHAKAYADYSRYAEGFIGAHLLMPGDFVRTSFLKRATTHTPAAHLPRLLGLYLAEGSLSVIKNNYTKADGSISEYLDYRTELTFNINETNLVEEAKDLIECFTGRRPSSFDYAEEHRTVVRSHSKELHIWLLLNGGKYSNSKIIAEEVMGWDTPYLKQVLEAWMEGDGTWNKINEVLSGTTVSRNLMWQITEIAARLNLIANVSSYTSKNANKQTAYTITFNSSATALLNISKVPSDWKPYIGTRRAVGHLKNQTQGQLTTQPVITSRAQCFIENGFIYRKLRTVKSIFINELVYDLTIPGDHGFQVHGYGVSNCRVPYDICSCCEKKASSPKNYCEHLKHNMLQYLPEFKKYAFAINDRPKFFDISAVEKPADRIAHYLDYAFPEGEKSASFHGVITGTQWAEFEGVKLPGADIVWEPNQQKMLEKLASYEEYINHIFTTKSASKDPKAAFVRDVIPNSFNEELEDKDIELLRKLQVGTMCRELAKRASILPFYSFIAYATGRKLQDTMDDPITKKACDMLPEIFKKLMTSGCGCELGNMFDAGSQYGSSNDPGNDDEVQKFMDSVEQKFSIKTEPVKNRVMTIMIVKGAKQLTKQASTIALSPSFENRALALAETYGLYKLSALNDIQNMHGEEIAEAQYLLAVGQNLI